MGLDIDGGCWWCSCGVVKEMRLFALPKREGTRAFVFVYGKLRVVFFSRDNFFLFLYTKR